MPNALMNINSTTNDFVISWFIKQRKIATKCEKQVNKQYLAVKWNTNLSLHVQY